MVSARDADQADHFMVDNSRRDDAAPQAPSSTGPVVVDTKGRGRGTLTVVFFALLVAHLVGNVDPRIIYQADDALPPDKAIPIFPVYYQGWEFLRPLLAEPGGLAEYVGANVSQYFNIPYGGVVILAGVALAAFLVTGKLVVMMGGRAGGLLRFVPPMLLVVIWNRYTFVLADQIALLAALLVTYLYFRLPDKAALRAAVLTAAIIVFYYVAGGLCMLPVAVCGLYELLSRRRPAGALYLAVGGLAPLVMGKLFGLSVSEAYLRLTGLSGGGSVATAAWAALYCFLAALAIGLALLHRLGWPAGWLADRLRGSLGRYGKGALGALGPPAALLAVAAAVALGTLDRNVRTFRRICYYFQTETWGGVIIQARKYSARAYSDIYTAGACRMLNRALFEQKRLSGEMFRYPQFPQVGLLPAVTLELGQPLDQPYKADTLLKLGAVDTANRLALDSLKRWGDRPFVLRLLAKIAIVKGDKDAAIEYLGRLSKDIVHGQFAREQLAKVNSGYDFGQDEEIAQIRSFMVPGNFSGPMAVQAMLEALVDRNPNNRMAFEYLMAHYLLTRQLEAFASRIGGVRDLGYEYMPPHYAEALLLLYVQTGQWPTDEELPQEAPDTLMQGERFAALEQQYRGDLQSLERAVAQELTGTYYGYYLGSLLQMQRAMGSGGR